MKQETPDHAEGICRPDQKLVCKEKKTSVFSAWWNTYLKRLNKVTGGKPQCCK